MTGENDTASEANVGESKTDPSLDMREAELTRLKAELAAKDQKLDEVLRAYAAAKNEHAEFRTRLQRERDRMIDVEKGKVAMSFLEAADELDRAIRAAGKDESPFAQGVRLVRDSMSRRMAEMGIVPLEIAGKAFDPNVCEAVDVVVVGDMARDGVVIDEVTRGYNLNGKLLRPARVRVGKHAPPSA
jgi:molecular chaperone GrpE